MTPFADRFSTATKFLAALHGFWGENGYRATDRPGHWWGACPACRSKGRREESERYPLAVIEKGERWTLVPACGCSQEAILAALDGSAAITESAPASLRLVPLAEFAAEVEPSAEVLLGSDDDAVFAAGGRAMTHGVGGDGKTTLSIDGVAHLAAGVSWLGLPVARPLRVVLIENEGPRAPFRRKLQRKIDTWAGPPFWPNVRVLDEPWAEFTFADERMRGALAAACDEFAADMLVVGPLVSLGVVGGGTPEEVSRFERLLRTFGAEVARMPFVWLIHHDNKAGDVSGAWERMPDTLMHVRLEGRGQTGVHWRKARWSSALHGERWTLRWLENSEGFERVDAPERDLRGEILALYEADPSAWRTLTEIAKPRKQGGIGRNRSAVSEEVEALVVEGLLVPETGPSGRSATAVCYRPAALVRGAEQVEQVGTPPPRDDLPAPDPPVGGRAEQVGEASALDLSGPRSTCAANGGPPERRMLTEDELIERLKHEFDAREIRPENEAA